MIHVDPPVSGVGDPETNRTSPDVGTPNTSQRAIFFWSLRFPSLSGRLMHVLGTATARVGCSY